jgi:superfamily II DNA or RNA helicase
MIYIIICIIIMLSTNGYSISKTSLKPEEIEKIKKELTMKPKVNFDMGNNKDAEEVVFELYRETEKRIYIPRYYGLVNYGVPKVLKLAGAGADISVGFVGKLREAQMEPVNNFLEAARNPRKMGGIISVPCGFGKTIMSLYIACALKKKTMFISHKDFLNQQFIETVKEFAPAASIGIIKQNKVDVENKDFIIASLQSLAMRDYDSKIFEDIGFVIIDEVHHTGAQVFCRAFKKLNTPIILGLSATLNRKDGMRKVFEYYIGGSVYSVKNKEYTDVIVNIHKYYVPDMEYSAIKKMWNGKENIAAMINNICSYKPRTEYIIAILTEILKNEPDRRVLILSERRNQLKSIEDYIVEKNIANKDYGYYVGGMKQEQLTVSSGKQIILATFQLASEGFNVPTLNTIIFASPISDIQQSIGRILRERPEDRKYIPLCIDISDEFSVFHRKTGARLRFYNNNKYKISYYQDNEKIEIDNGDAGDAGDAEAGDADNEGYAGADRTARTAGTAGTKGAKKPMFINDDDE